MKILLSAYACEPNKGSEPGIGWHWAVELAKMGHAVTVITRTNNRAAIEEGLPNLGTGLKLRWLYYDLPVWLRKIKRIPGGIYWYYFYWQLGGFFRARKKHRLDPFDAVHHITFGSIRQPSFMGNLGIPFVFGPVAGGEHAPRALRKGYPLRGKCLEFFRDIMNWAVRMDPLMHMVFRQAETVVVTSDQTRALVPSKYQHKCVIHLAIGAEEQRAVVRARTPAESRVFRIEYAGRLIYWKGIHLALRAFAVFHQHVPNSRMTIIGSGPEQAWLRAMATSLRVSAAVEWIPWLERREIMTTYETHQAFLFPSLHDSGGLVVLEALSFGLPTVTLDLGGPGIIVDQTCGFRVATAGTTEERVVMELAESLIQLATDSTLYSRLSKEARNRAGQFTWERQVRTLGSQVFKAEYEASECAW